MEPSRLSGRHIWSTDFDPALVGYSTWTDTQINNYVVHGMKNNGGYDILDNNCVNFAQNLIEGITREPLGFKGLITAIIETLGIVI